MIPFPGEYQLFRESSVRLPPDSLERPGSPLDAVYVSTNGGARETEAYQGLRPAGRLHHLREDSGGAD